MTSPRNAPMSIFYARITPIVALHMTPRMVGSASSAGRCSQEGKVTHPFARKIRLQRLPNLHASTHQVHVLPALSLSVLRMSWLDWRGVQRRECGRNRDFVRALNITGDAAAATSTEDLDKSANMCFVGVMCTSGPLPR